MGAVDENSIEISITNDVCEIAGVAARIDEFCETRGIGRKIANAVNVSIDEILTNTIAYGYDNQPHRIEIALCQEADALVIAITDDSKEFDPSGPPPEVDFDATLEDRAVGGLGLFLVDREASGVSVRLQTGWIGDKVCEVNFENVEAGASSVIGPAVGAWPAIEKARERGTAMLCAYMAGGARKVADMARDYSQTREAFGVTIGTFQRVQDRVIQANDDADATMWTAYEALTKLDEGAGDASASVSTAKVVASISFPRACEESHHVHGGIGTDLDFGLVHYTKRARTFQSYLGDANYHRNRIAELLKL